MGWWSEDIMGGDTPYDIATTVDEMITGEKFDEMHMPDHWSEDQQKLVRDGFEQYGGPKKVADKMKETWPGYDHVYIDQVVALLAMSSGAPICEDFRRQTIEACDTSQLESQGWCDDGSRTKVLTALQELAEKYDGKTETMRQTGLFEKMFGGGE